MGLLYQLRGILDLKKWIQPGEVKLFRKFLYDDKWLHYMMDIIFIWWKSFYGRLLQQNIDGREYRGSPIKRGNAEVTIN